MHVVTRILRGRGRLLAAVIVAAVSALGIVCALLSPRTPVSHPASPKATQHVMQSQRPPTVCSLVSVKQVAKIMRNPHTIAATPDESTDCGYGPKAFRHDPRDVSYDVSVTRYKSKKAAVSDYWWNYHQDSPKGLQIYNSWGRLLKFARTTSHLKGMIEQYQVVGPYGWFVVVVKTPVGYAEMELYDYLRPATPAEAQSLFGYVSQRL